MHVCYVDLTISIIYRVFFFKSVGSFNNIFPLSSPTLIAVFFTRIPHSHFALYSHFSRFLSFVVLLPIVTLLETASSFMFQHLTVQQLLSLSLFDQDIYILFEYFNLIISSVFLILTSVHKHINVSPNCSRAVCFESAAPHHINPI